jgi:hypothetical protein
MKAPACALAWALATIATATLFRWLTEQEDGQS